MKAILKCCIGVAVLTLLLSNSALAGIIVTKNVDGYINDGFRNAPVAGAAVTFTPMSLSKTNYSVTTNSAGYYVVPNLIWYVDNRVPYMVTVTAPGYENFTTQTSTSGQPVYFNGGSRYNIALRPTSAAELKGTVTDQTGKMLSGITVVLKPTAYGYGTKDYTTVTDANGNYDLTDVLAYVYSSGSAPKWFAYNLYVNAGGYNDYTSSLFDFKTKRVLTQNATLTYAGQRYEGYVSQVIYAQDVTVTGYNERYVLVKNTGEPIGFIGIDRSNSNLVPLLQTAFQARCKVIFTAGHIDKDAIYDVSYVELGDNSTGLSRIENKLGTVKE